MFGVNYIDYASLKSIYSMAEAAELMNISVDMLWDRCIRNDVFPCLDPFGEATIDCYEFRRVHYAVYHELP